VLLLGASFCNATCCRARWQGERLLTAAGLAGAGHSQAATGRWLNPAIWRCCFDPTGLELSDDPQGDAWVTGREFLGREWLLQVQLSHPGQAPIQLRLPAAAGSGVQPRPALAGWRLRPGQPALLFPQGLTVLPFAGDPQPTEPQFA